MADDAKEDITEKASKPASDAKPKRSTKSKILRGVGIFFGVLVVAILGFVIYVNATWERDFKATPMPALQASKDPDVIKRGSYVANSIAHCSACHGTGEFTTQLKLSPNIDDLRGGYVIKAGPFGTYYPPNITPDNETGIGKMSDAELARVLKYGVGPDGKLDLFMSFAVGPIADEDIIAIMSYLRSIPPIAQKQPKDEWGFIAKAMSSKFNPKAFPVPTFVKEGEASIERGTYIARGPGLCIGCHSPYDYMHGMTLAGPEFSGGFEPEPDSKDPSKEIMAPNLTTDPKTGVLANFTEDQFLDRVKKVGRAVQGSTMPWENFARMSDEDLRSIYRYLSKVPPANRATGPTSRPSGWKG